MERTPVMSVRGSLLAIMAATFTIGAAADQPDFTKVRQLITERMASESVPSVAVSVVRNGQIVWEEGFNAGARTPFALASVTKTLTGRAVTMLVERGRIDLDQPVNSYLGSAK